MRLQPGHRGTEELINGIEPEMARLKARALLLDDRDAATELLRRATEVQQYLGPVLMDAPHLLADEAVDRFEMPAFVALSRGHRYYYKKVVAKLRELKLGSKTGIACHERANWKSDGHTGALAVTLYNTVEALRTKSPSPGDHLTKAIVRMVQADYKDIAAAASKLNKFGRENANDWIGMACLPILFIVRPDLRPARRGKRKQADKERADPRAKRQRDAIVQRIRDMAAGPDKSRSRGWK